MSVGSPEGLEKHEKTFFVDVEGVDYPWYQPTISPEEIRTMAGIPGDQQVIEVNLKDGTERTLAEGEHVEVKPGHGFAKKVRFQRG